MFQLSCKIKFVTQFIYLQVSFNKTISYSMRSQLTGLQIFIQLFYFILPIFYIQSVQFILIY